MKNVDLYYESLNQVYDEILTWEPPKPRSIQKLIDWVVGLFAVLMGLSVIPVIPAILMLVDDQLPIVIGPIDTTDGSFTSFGYLFLGTVISSGILLAFALLINSKIDERYAIDDRQRPPQSLSPEQFSFVSIYKAYRELKVYFVSHIDKHVANSFDAMMRILPRHRLGRFSSETVSQYREIERLAILSEIEDDRDIRLASEMGILGSPSFRGLSSDFPADVSIARSFLRSFGNYAWFDMDSQSKETLQAIISFPSKVPPRLKEREDLTTVLLVLEDFARFLYAFLPEHKTHLEPQEFETLKEDGLAHLKGFVSSVNDMPEYTFEDEAYEREEDSSAQSLFSRIRNIHMVHVIVRFVVWFVLIGMLTTLAVLIFNQFVLLSSDTMATLIIGASISGAAALTALNPSLKPKQEKLAD